MRSLPLPATKDYVARYYDEKGEGKPQQCWDDSDELFLNAPGTTAWRKSIERENWRRFGHPFGEAAANAERDRALATWQSEGGR